MGPVRGRVIARAGSRFLVRAAEADTMARWDGAPERAPEPGDWVELSAAAGPGDNEPVIAGLARRLGLTDYPGRESEVARLSRTRLQRLVERDRALRAVRRFFQDRGFVEVETPLLVPAPSLEVHLTAVAAGSGWLITSPEFQMKRLLAAGLERIFTVCKCFRAGESGRHHGVEFTMLEWYRAFDDLEAILGDTEELVAEAARAVIGSTRIPARAERGEVDVAPPWPRITVADAMAEHAGVIVHGDEDAEVLAESVRAAGIDIGGATAWDDIFYTAFVDRVEPALARMSRPVAVLDWPARLAALARRKPGAEHVVERFEVYVAGLELANAFGELICAREQRQRFEAELAAREQRGLPGYPIDEKLLAALREGLPPCAGIALGIDRLVMLLTGADDIAQVLTFTASEL